MIAAFEYFEKCNKLNMPITLNNNNNYYKVNT